MSGGQGQLTYASFDAQGAHRGGWQVKEAIGLPPGVVPDQVVDRVVTTLDVGPVPAYPTSEERTRLPRRVLFGWLGEHPAWWSSVPAGADASGRQGNVFTHVVVGEGPRRPAALTASPGWLAPFGAHEVASATLRHPPRPVDLVESTRRLLDEGPGWPLGTLAVVADAVVAALGDRGAVALVCETTQEAADWVGALALCCSPRTGARLSYSTFERASSGRAWAGDGLRLVCIPRSDLEAALDLPDVVVVDPLGDVEVAEPGQHHRCGTGQTVPATEWSALIVDQLGDTAELAAVVTDIDGLAEHVGDTDLALVWPLAMRGALHRRVGTEKAVARALVRTTPDRVGSDPRLYAEVSRALRSEMGATPAARWAALGGMADASPLMLQLATLTYAEAALADPAWLAEPGEPRLPPPVRPQPTPDAYAAARLGLDRLPSLPPVDSARAALRAVMLVERLGWTSDPALETALQSLLDVVIAGLRSGSADEIVGTSGRLDPEVAAIVAWGLRWAVVPEEGALGHRVAPSAFAFLGLGPDRLADRQWMWLQGRPSALAAELAVHTLRGSAATQQLRRTAAYVATDALLRDGPEKDPRGEIRDLVAREELDVADLAVLAQKFRGAVGERPVLSALLREPEGGSLSDLADTIAADWDFGHETRQLAELRKTIGPAASRPPLPSEVDLVRRKADEALDGAYGRIDPVLLARLHVGALAGLLRGEPAPSVHALPCPPVPADRVSDGVRAVTILTPFDLLTTVVALHPHSPERTVPPDTAAWLAGATTQTGELLLDAVATGVLTRWSDADVHHAAELVGPGRDKFLSKWLQRNRPRSVRARIGGLFGRAGSEE